MPTDFYEILGVKKRTSQDDIKKAYKKLARKFHPDVNPGDKNSEKRFKEISEAYAVLGDAKKRKAYDMHGTVPNFDFGQAGAPGHFGDIDFDLLRGMDFSSFGGGVGDLLSDMFSGMGGATGGPRQRRRSPYREPVPQKGADIHTSLDLTFQESLEGKSVKVRIRRQVRKKDSPELSPSDETISIKVPAGVDNGSRVRAAGKGNGGAYGGAYGDLFLEVRVKAHPFFRRNGWNLECDVPITVTEAALGDKIKVPTPWGASLMKVPPGTKSEQTFRIREKGMPVLGKSGQKGDLYVKVKIVVPDIHDERSKEILRELAELNSANPREDLEKYS